MKTYRVFVSRHYIAVDFFDIEANNARDAEKAAEKVVKRMIPDARMDAVDNGWHSDEATQIPFIGSSKGDLRMRVVYEDPRATVYHNEP